MTSKQIYYFLFPERQLESYVVAIMGLVKRDRVSFYTYSLNDVPELINYVTALPHLPVLVEQRNVVSGGFTSILHYLDSRIPEPALASYESNLFAKELSMYSVLFDKLNGLISKIERASASELEISNAFTSVFEECELVSGGGYLVYRGKFNIVDCLMLGFVSMCEDLDYKYISSIDLYPNFEKYIASLSSYEYKNKLLDSLNNSRVTIPFWEKPSFDINLYIS